MKISKYQIKLFIYRIISIIGRVFVKSKNKILIYSDIGFRDNVKALYDFLVENNFNKKYKIYVSLNDYQKYKKVGIKNVKFISNKVAIFYHIRVKYVFYSFGKIPVKPTKQQMVVNLWHGMPLKKIGDTNKSIRTPKYDTHILATSEFFAPIMKDTMNSDNVIIAGQPRNDNLSKKVSVDIFDGYDKIIMWMPTFRRCTWLGYFDSNSTDVLPCCTNSEMEILNSILLENNALLYIKLHPLQDFNSADKIEYSNIIMHTHEEFSQLNIDLYAMLGHSSALITDYSSVYFDYLLMDKPIIFVIEDINQYQNKRGFVFDNPLEFMPGDKTTNFEELKKSILDVLNNIDNHRIERKRINNLCNKYQNGNYTSHLLTQLGICL